MWRIIMFSILLHILSVECQPMDSAEDLRWPNSLASPSSRELLLKHHAQIMKQRNPSYNVYRSDVDYDVLLPKIPHDKRALAMIARWGPFSNIGKQRSPIRSSFVDPENNINTQTRGRMVGQPLRWG